MADTLLRELSNADLDWLITHGDRARLAAGQAMLTTLEERDRLYIVVEGKLGLSLVQPGTRALDEAVLIDELNQGEIIGIEALFGLPLMASVRTLEPAMVMSLGVAALQVKLLEDVAFAAHFYRAIAIMLSNRLRNIFEQPNRIQFWGERSAKEVLSVFGELRDSDVDWLTAFGQTLAIAPGQVLLQAGRPVDAFYILLDGQLSISAPQQGTFNPLYLCFSGLEQSTRDQQAFATLTKGGMPGIISFLDFRPLPTTVRATKEALLFAVPRQTLVTKLQVDDSFASRFYRVIALEILELLQTISIRLVGAAYHGAEGQIDEELDL
ncbi:MAG TPA: cyclic nucleotide-binding domain-containing protein, partial [Candidatus Obscuribacterales bacterium]